MNDNGPWHLDKRVPIALIMALLVQTSGAVWWAASISGTVEEQGRVSVRHETRMDRYDTQMQGLRDTASSQAVAMGRLEQELSGIRATLTRIDRSQEQTNALLREYLQRREAE